MFKLKTMKLFVKTFLLLLLPVFAMPQNMITDSLTHKLAIATQDTSRVLIMTDLSFKYRLSKLDSAMKYGQQALALAQQIKYSKGEAMALNNLGYGYRELGDLPKALDFVLKGMRIAEEHQFIDVVGECNRTLGVLYYDLEQYPKAIDYIQKAMIIYKKMKNQYLQTLVNATIGASYIKNNQFDSGKYYIQLAYKGAIELNDAERLPIIFRSFGWIEIHSGNNGLALDYFKQGIQLALLFNDHRNGAYNYNEIAKLFQKMNHSDSCIYYAKKGLAQGQKGPYNIRILESSILLSEAYKSKNDFKQAYQYQELMVKTKESLYGAGNIQAMQTMIADDEARRKEVEDEKIANQNKLKQYGLLAGLGFFALIGLMLYRNNLKEKRAKIQLQEKNEVIEQTLNNLKATQNQLIQSEKLASLGELTAGIAHEIQNPLNFVNNFSELSVDLAKDINTEIHQPKLIQIMLKNC